MILCDTNILIDIYRSNAKTIEIIKQIGQENIAISDVTCAELLFGARNKKELKLIRTDINKLTVLPIQPNISNLAVQLIEKYSLSHNLAFPDALIASTAIFHNIELFTLNIKDFKFLENIKLFEMK